MRPPTVVMIDEDGQRALQMPCVQNQEPIKAFGSSAADKPLCDPIRLGRLNRRPNDSDVFGLEDGIKADLELATMIADQKTNRFGTFGERPGLYSARTQSERRCNETSRTARTLRTLGLAHSQN